MCIIYFNWSYGTHMFFINLLFAGAHEIASLSSSLFCVCKTCGFHNIFYLQDFTISFQRRTIKNIFKNEHSIIKIAHSYTFEAICQGLNQNNILVRTHANHRYICLFLM